MIDYIHAHIKIPIPHNSFEWMLWKKRISGDGTIKYYWYLYKGVRLYYYPWNKHLTIKGKLIRLLHDTWVLNPDDLYQDEV